MKSNLLEWHFSFTGVEGSNYEGGIYHGKIRLNPDYPQKAPTISLLTPSGRWEVKTDICLSATAHHQELWDPSWTMKTLILSLRGFMITQPGEIGSIISDLETQKRLALASRSWKCPDCGIDHAHLCGDFIDTNNIGKSSKLFLAEEAALLFKPKATFNGKKSRNFTKLTTKSASPLQIIQRWATQLKLISGMFCFYIFLHQLRKGF